MTEAPAAPIHFAAVHAGDDSDELARAELYGLLSQLWLAPPDATLLEQFRVAVTEAPQAGGLLEAPWQALVAAMRATSVEAAAAEHEALFYGVGKPEVFVYGSYYLSGFLHERPLAALRESLAQLGLTRDAQRAETEDHVAYVLEVMRYLIAGDDAGVCNLEQQRRFFRAHVQSWVEALCEAVLAHPRAELWRAVAGFTQAFVQVETQAFDLLET
ncbi:cytoplasmic chaperone TorD family protein [Leptothrix cholodnii SP-6]|uniref:Cytoplasmic chaperone TorD family protein n=1 Tax=Leptothrix cholodnii (strain ATCC 51168 / LMG 8142 / SP-6) TaxID=395495 RepID=B1Y5U1_LEPCP|nr:molecular chaperone TorD family protein [Leptothrix cholodnii]ACB35987.1 cytoplasmic chaperone TorD family protein [Leptothrix cholodnii SP-6]